MWGNKLVLVVGALSIMDSLGIVCCRRIDLLVDFAFEGKRMVMDIHTPKGSLVVFTGNGGYDAENRRARQELIVGKMYTVVDIEIGGWSSRVALKEVDGKWNTVMFENTDGLERASEIARDNK